MNAPFTDRLRTFVALPLLLLAIVAGGSTGLAGLQLTPAVDVIATTPDRPVQAVLAQTSDESRLEAASGDMAASGLVSSSTPAPAVVAAIGLYERTAERLRPPTPPTAPVEVERPVKPQKEPKAVKPEKAAAARPTGPRTFSGKNHFWMPVLGIDKKVHDYPCPRKRPPDHYVYRWWCAGDNNVYLLGHASSVMKPLHDVYVSGNLRVGMAAWYADADGVVTKYRITEWRVVRPEESHWAIAHQPVPSMTLQTCVGKNDEFRLNVRLVAVDYL